MRYALSRCTAAADGDDVVITGPYIDTGETHSVRVPRAGLEAYMSGAKLIQHAFPNLTADDREFLISGISPAGWDNMFGG